MLKEFKKFIDRGNVLDLAVGVIVGGSFSSIVTSLVENVFTPVIGLVVGGVDFSNLAITFKDKDTKIMYGAFIQSVIDFLIVAFCLFLIVKAFNKLTKKKEEKPNVPSKSQELKTLEEIRDLLKNEVQDK